MIYCNSMFSTNTEQKVLSYQSKTNNNRISEPLLREENNLIFSTKNVAKAVINHKYIPAQINLKEENTLVKSKNSIVNPEKMMFSSVYRICVVCFFETLKLIKGTLEQIDSRRTKTGLLSHRDSDNSGSPVTIKRERTVRKKYTTGASATKNSSSNVCYVQTKVDPGLLRQRAEKYNQERRSSVKIESYTKLDRDMNVDLPKRSRSITFPGENGKTTTIKVISATKTPQNCCLKNPSQNYTALVSALNGDAKSFDQFMIRASRNLGRGYRKRHSVPPTNLRSPRSNSPIFRRRSLEVVLEEEE